MGLMELSDEVKQIVSELTEIINNCAPVCEEDKFGLRQFLQYPLIQAYWKGIENKANVKLKDEESNARLREKVHYGLTWED